MVALFLIFIEDQDDAAVQIGQQRVVVMREIVKNRCQLASLLGRQIQLLFPLGQRNAVSQRRGAVIYGSAIQVLHSDGANCAATQKYQEKRNNGDAFRGPGQCDGSHG